MERPDRIKRPGRGRHIDRSRRTVSGKYFELVCLLVGVSQEEVARKAKEPSSTLTRGFSGERSIDRKKLLEWGDILSDLCPESERPILLEMEKQMLHTLGYATREEQNEGISRFPYYEQIVYRVLKGNETEGEQSSS